MEYTRSSVRLRAYGQRDPLIEYKNEAVRLFRELESAIKYNIFFSFFQLAPPPKSLVGGLGAAHGHIHKVEQPASNVKIGENKKIGRNVPCPCGKKNPTTDKPIKYKKCCYPKFG